MLLSTPLWRRPTTNSFALDGCCRSIVGSRQVKVKWGNADRAGDVRRCGPGLCRGGRGTRSLLMDEWAPGERSVREGENEDCTWKSWNHAMVAVADP